MDSSDERTRQLLDELRRCWDDLNEHGSQVGAWEICQELIALNPNNKRVKTSVYTATYDMAELHFNRPKSCVGCMASPVFIVLSVLLFTYTHWSVAAAPAIMVISLFFICKVTSDKAKRRYFANGLMEDLMIGVRHWGYCCMLCCLIPFAAIMIIVAFGGMVVSIIP